MTNSGASGVVTTYLPNVTAGSERVLRAGGGPAQLACEVPQGPLVFHPVVPPRPAGAPGLRTNDVAASFAYLAVYALGGPLEGVPPSSPPVHRYPFDGADAAIAVDVAGDADGVLLAGATLDGQGRLLLDGLEAYVDLPNGIISSLPAITVEAWVEWNGVGAGLWQRIFDFGSNSAGEITGPGGGPFGANDVAFLQVSPHTVHETLRVTAWAGTGSESDDDLFAYVDTDPLPSGRPVHVAVTYDPAAGRIVLYVDGAERASDRLTFPLSLLDDVNNWIGRSNYSNDPSFDGAIDELRIYDYALSPREVMGSFVAGPDGP